MTIGTTATIAAAREIKDVPIVFSIVYDPIEAGIAKGGRVRATTPRVQCPHPHGSARAIAEKIGTGEEAGSALYAG